MSDNYKEYMLDSQLNNIKRKYEYELNSNEIRAMLKNDLDSLVFAHNYSDIIYERNGGYFKLIGLSFLEHNPLDIKKHWSEFKWPIMHLRLKLY
jgi:hypothetical protein